MQVHIEGDKAFDTLRYIYNLWGVIDFPLEIPLELSFFRALERLSREIIDSFLVLRISNLPDTQLSADIRLNSPLNPHAYLNIYEKVTTQRNKCLGLRRIPYRLSYPLSYSHISSHTPLSISTVEHK